jgi:hypothetical protein
MAEAPLKFVPVMTTVVPPAVLPLVVFKPVMAGAGAAAYVNLSAELGADTPFEFETATSHVPAVCAGATAVI